MSGANEGHPPSSCSPVTIEKMIGGGDSWYYAVQGGNVLGAAHEDNAKEMQRLYDIQGANTTAHVRAVASNVEQIVGH